MIDDNPKGRCSRCGAELNFKDKTCPNCGGPNDNWVIPGKDQCGNCHAGIEEGDRYCRRCGTKVGEGSFSPYQNMMWCIYGPRPQKRIHTCVNCGYSWSTYSMIDDELFCPKCGGNAPAQEEEDFC